MINRRIEFSAYFDASHSFIIGNFNGEVFDKVSIVRFCELGPSRDDYYLVRMDDGISRVVYPLHITKII